MFMLPTAPDPQDTGYTCGPAATKLVLATRGLYVAESELAVAENTDPDDGTMRAEIVEELRTRLHVPYVDQPIPGATATQQERADMLSRVRATVYGGYGTVVNVVGRAYDSNGRAHQYGPPGGHYVAVVGADDTAAMINDPAFGIYPMPWGALADWSAERGYLFLPNASSYTSEVVQMLGKVKGNDTVWVSDGLRRRPVGNWDACKLVYGPQPHVIEFPNEAWLADQFGPVDQVQTGAGSVPAGVLKSGDTVTLTLP